MCRPCHNAYVVQLTEAHAAGATVGPGGRPLKVKTPCDDCGAPPSELEPRYRICRACRAKRQADYITRKKAAA